jgi:hypothetical protein
VLHGDLLSDLRARSRRLRRDPRGLAQRKAIGTRIEQPRWLAALAEGYRTTGRPREALGVILDALEVVRRTGERYWEAEIWRLGGELSLDASRAGYGTSRATGRAWIRRAAAIASRQGAIALARAARTAR